MLKNDSVWLHHLFLIVLSCQWIMALLHVLAVVNSAAAKNMGVHMSLRPWFQLLWGMYPEIRSHGNYISNSLKNLQSVSLWLHWFTFLPVVHKHSKFSTSSPVPAVFRLCCCVVSSHPDGYEGVSLPRFSFAFLQWLVMLSILFIEHLFIEHLFIFFEKGLFRSFARFWKVWLLCGWSSTWIVHISWISDPLSLIR